MVQYQPNYLRRTKITKHKWYWKLEHVPDYCGTLRSFLNNRNYLFKQSSKKPRLNKLATRAQRCLPSYETCSIMELKAICAQQRLQLSGLEKKQDLIDRLELEDESRTFHGFLDLPA